MRVNAYCAVCCREMTRSEKPNTVWIARLRKPCSMWHCDRCGQKTILISESMAQESNTPEDEDFVFQETAVHGKAAATTIPEWEGTPGSGDPPGSEQVTPTSPWSRPTRIIR